MVSTKPTWNLLHRRTQFYSAHVSRVAQSLTAWSSRLWPYSQIKTLRCILHRSALDLSIIITGLLYIIMYKCFGTTKLKHISLFTPWSNSLFDCTDECCLLLYIASSDVFKYFDLTSIQANTSITVQFTSVSVHPASSKSHHTVQQK